MTVVPLDRLPRADAADDGPPLAGAPAPDASSFANAVGDAVANASAALERADAADRAFAAHRGGLAEMVLERARADVVLSLASAAATRTAQSLATILGMQV